MWNATERSLHNRGIAQTSQSNVSRHIIHCQVSARGCYDHLHPHVIGRRAPAPAQANQFVRPTLGWAPGLCSHQAAPSRKGLCLWATSLYGRQAGAGFSYWSVLSLLSSERDKNSKCVVQKRQRAAWCPGPAAPGQTLWYWCCISGTSGPVLGGEPAVRGRVKSEKWAVIATYLLVL